MNSRNRIVVTNRIFPETRALLEAHAELVVNEGGAAVAGPQPQGASVSALDAIAIQIPEPGSMTLLVTGAAIALGSRRRRE